METLHAHYARLLGIDEAWKVEAVDLQLAQRRVEIRLTHVAPHVHCPDCGRVCGLADYAPERRWRHLDSMQFATELVSRLPRSTAGTVVGRAADHHGPRGWHRFLNRCGEAARGFVKAAHICSLLSLRDPGSENRSHPR